MKKFLLVGVIFFIIGAAVGFGISRFFYDSRTISNMNYDELMEYAEDEEMKEDAALSAENEEDNLLMVADQSAGNRVTVAKISLADAGWVVIHEGRAGKPGNILGALRVDPGAHSGLVVELLRETVGGQAYYAMLHSDNGDKKFDHAVDLPMSGESGSALMQKFMVTK